MQYLRSFSLASESDEVDFMFSNASYQLDMACYSQNNAYPFHIFPKKSLKKLLKNSNLFEKTSDVADCSYFNTEMLTYDSFKDSIFFYPLENRKQAAGNVTAFRDRMDMANANSTYVVIKGSYSGKADHYTDFDKEKYSGQENAEAKVTYYIPLGYVNGNLNDYNVRRNTKYIYNITVNGIDDIVLEVVSEGDKSSVEDGDVIYLNGGKVIDLDAHYASDILTFTKADLESKSEITYKVKSPYTSGYQTGVDSDWVKFVINGKRQGVYSRLSLRRSGACAPHGADAGASAHRHTL